MSWRVTKKALITNKTGCEPCKELAALRGDLAGDFGVLHNRVNDVSSTLAAHGSGLGVLHNRVNDVSSTLAAHGSGLGVLHNRVNDVSSTLASHDSNIKHLNSMFDSTPSTQTFTYTEPATNDFRPGPISVEFYMATVAPPDSPGGALSALNKFIIDNNGNGYISLTDLFTTTQGTSNFSGLNDKIKKLVEDSKIGSSDYFENSVKAADQSLPIAERSCYTISELTIKFGSGQSYVVNPDEQGTEGLGDPWGAPLFFEIGGQRYANDGKTYTPDNKKAKFTISGPDGKGGTADFTVQINQVRIVGNGQGSTTIRGSCIFVLYNMIDSGVSLESGGGGGFGANVWPSKPSFLTFSNRRVVSGGYQWTGHFGICNDYDESIGNAAAYRIGNVPRIMPGANPEINIAIPNYQGATDVPMDKSVEYLLIDAWIELEQDTLSGIQEALEIGYPVLTIGAIIPRRFYLKNVVCFSYQTVNTESKGLTSMNTSYIKNNDGLPVDTFVENCSFAARNTNSIPSPVPTARSFVVRNADKLSLMTSTFHGNMDLSANKVAAYNCYSLAVGQPTVSTDIVNYNIVVSVPDQTEAAGYGGVRTSSRVILQNMIFITHLDKDGIAKEFPSSTINKLTDLATELKTEAYLYDKPKSLYPLKLTNFTTPNVFISNSTYYGVMMGTTGPPTFSVFELNSANIVQLAVPAPTATPALGNVL